MPEIAVKTPPISIKRLKLAHKRLKLATTGENSTVISRIFHACVMVVHFFSNHFSNSTNFLGKQVSAKRGNPSDGKNLLSSTWKALGKSLRVDVPSWTRDKCDQSYNSNTKNSNKTCSQPLHLSQWENAGANRTQASLHSLAPHSIISHL